MWLPDVSSFQLMSPRCSQHGDGSGTVWSRVFPFLVVSPVIIGVTWLVMMWFVRQLYYEFG